MLKWMRFAMVIEIQNFVLIGEEEVQREIENILVRMRWMKDACNACVCIKGSRTITTSYMSDFYNQHLPLAYLEAYLEPSPTQYDVAFSRKQLMDCICLNMPLYTYTQKISDFKNIFCSVFSGKILKARKLLTLKQADF